MELVAFYLAAAMILTMWLDATRYTIPNSLVGALGLLYAMSLFISPHAVDWPMALVGALLVFAVGSVLFSMRVMGGGDVKLIAVLAVWVGWERLMDFIMLFAILGGIFTLALLMVRPVVQWLPIRSTPRLLQKNAPIPYGVAIAAAFLWLMYQDKIPLL